MNVSGFKIEIADMWFFAILPLCFVVVVLFFKWKFSYWNKLGVYTSEVHVPFGTAKNIINQKRSLSFDLKHYYYHFKERSLDFGGYYFFTRPVFIPVHLDLIKKILLTDFEHFTDHSLFAAEYEPLSQHLFALKGDRWKTARFKLTPAFTASKNKLLFNTVLECTGELLNVLNAAADGNEKVGMKDLSIKYTIDVISLCAFGFNCDSLKNSNSEICKIVQRFFDTSPRKTVISLLGWIYPNILSFFKIKFYDKDLSDFFLNLIKETVNYREANKVVRADFVHLLLQIRNSKQENGNDEPQLTIEEMAAHSLNFFLAGYETSALTVTYCLYELAINDKMQSEARSEIQRSLVTHAPDGKLNYKVVQELPYVKKIVCETLRKYAPFPQLLRECTKDFAIPNTNIIIKKGTPVFVPILGVHADPDVYPNPDQFDPERFSSEEINRRHPCAFLPFGVGPRTCIAYTFGVMMINIAIASILSKYIVTLDESTELPLQYNTKSITLIPKNEIFLNFKKL